MNCLNCNECKGTLNPFCERLQCPVVDPGKPPCGRAGETGTDRQNREKLRELNRKYYASADALTYCVTENQGE